MRPESNSNNTFNEGLICNIDNEHHLHTEAWWWHHIEHYSLLLLWLTLSLVVFARKRLIRFVVTYLKHLIRLLHLLCYDGLLCEMWDNQCSFLGHQVNKRLKHTMMPHTCVTSNANWLDRKSFTADLWPTVWFQNLEGEYLRKLL